MISQLASKSTVVILSAAVLVAGLVYITVAAYLVLSPSPTLAAAALTKMDPSLSGPALGADHTRQLQPAVTAETYIFNKSNVKCKKQDRVFRKRSKNLHTCFELCSNTPDCNHFSYVFKGKLEGRCMGCRRGLTASHQPSTFFSLVRPDDVELAFSCPGFDSRTESQQAAIISLCETATSTSTSTSTSSTSSLSSSSSSNSTTSLSSPSSLSTSMSSPSTSSTTSTSTRTPKVFVPQDREELRRALWWWMVRREEALEEYGHISSWSTSLIRDMSYLFNTFLEFNEDISAWDVSSVEDMQSMFASNYAFNQSISGWNVSKVRNMDRMFWGALVFNQDISAWNVGRVENMDHMFADAQAFNQDISGWDVSSVSGYDFFYQGGSLVLGTSGGMSGMFRGASAFNKNISAWNVSNVVSMRYMFHSAKSFNQDISGWNVSKVRDMNSMFYGAEAFNMDISAWDVSSVMNMADAFRDAISFNQDISGWNVSSVGKCWLQCGMNRMFYGAEAFNDVDISIWTPVSLRSPPSKFISCSAASFRNGNWSGWGSKAPRCY